jgi:hypothetical protein
MTKATLGNKDFRKSWVVTVDMGYGHERAAHALTDLAYGDIIVANNYKGIPESDKKLWKESRQVYEAVSRFKTFPFLGNLAFNLFDSFQEIEPFYPRRDMHEPNLQVRQLYYLIEKKGMGRDLIDRLRKRRMPLITTFFLPAFAADYFDYPEEIYLVTCDADVSRAWVAQDPKRSRIKYFASNGRVVERLKLYGVPPENIFLTGFPLSKQLIGGPDSPTIKEDLGERICHLDPNGIFWQKYQDTLTHELGAANCRRVPSRKLTITFAVGGAGAQRELGLVVAESLREKIRRGLVQLNLVAGTNKAVAELFKERLHELGLGSDLGDGVKIHWWSSRQEYFSRFDELLRKSDVLWTKPSELSFYAGVGLPIIAAPPIGSQEKFNMLWLQSVGAGFPQFDPRYTSEWLFDWVESGGLARMAWNGYIEAPTHGAYRIEQIITGLEVELEKLPLIV